jgi:zinc transport system ATP-binding protein
MTLVEVGGATFGYGTRRVVRVERLALERGRCVGVYGPNGAGKTTLVRGILGLLEPLEGSVTASPDLLPGYMPQNRALQLHWPMSGMDVAAMTVSARRRFGFVGGAKRRLREAMRELGVDDLANRRFAALSGGQQQRLLLAGIIAADPNLIVLDEPTDGLDARTRDRLLQHLRTMLSRAAMVLISHDVDELLHVADEVAWVHPADEPDEPSAAELISPRELAERVAGVKAVSA